MTPTLSPAPMAPTTPEAFSAGESHGNSVVVTRGLVKRFFTGGGLGFRRRAVATVLRGVDLEIHQGEVFGLMGPNGAGKTTLMEILAGVLLPDEGTATVRGFDVKTAGSAARSRVGYCPSGSATFFPRLTARANLEFFAALHGLSARAARERTEAALQLVGLNGSSGLTFQRLSEGMKQRLAFARAIIPEPDVLLLDEPTKSLDPLLQSELGAFIKVTLAERLRKTVLLVTHSVHEAEAVCGRVAILHQGRVQALGTPDEVARQCGACRLTDAYAGIVGHDAH